MDRFGVKAKVEEIKREEKELRKQVSRLASMANKRIQRLEQSELTDTPAYKSWEENGAHKFSVRGKTYQEVQAEYWRVKKFIENKTSTVTGAKQVLYDMASATGIEYTDIADLQAKASSFFSIASKVKQYLQSVGDSAIALDYQKIWEQINLYIKEENVELAGAEGDLQAIDDIVSRMLQLKEEETYYSEFDKLFDAMEKGGWFKV